MARAPCPGPPTMIHLLRVILGLATLSTLFGCAAPGGYPPPFESDMSFRLMLYG